MTMPDSHLRPFSRVIDVRRDRVVMGVIGCGGVTVRLPAARVRMAHRRRRNTSSQQRWGQAEADQKTLNPQLHSVHRF